MRGPAFGCSMSVEGGRFIAVNGGVGVDTPLIGNEDGWCLTAGGFEGTVCCGATGAGAGSHGICPTWRSVSLFFHPCTRCQHENDSSL